MKLARHLTLPLDAVSRTIAVLSQKGWGKTYTGMKMAELMLEQGAQVVALDPTGVWWGLKAEGKGAGFPIIVMGGGRADVPLEHTSGRIIADFVTRTGQSVVLDLSHFTSNSQQDQFVAEFGEQLYRNKAHSKTPLHLMMDEADSFAPQNPRRGGWELKTLGAIEAIVRRGRSRGLGMTMISQRPAVLNKNVLTQCDLLIAGRIVGLQDHKALREWTGLHGTASQQNEFMKTLPILENGQAFFWSPEWLKCFESHQVTERRTFDSSKTPDVGVKVKAPKFAPVDLAALTAEIQATVEKAKADDPRALRAENAKLRGKIIELDAEIVRLKDAAPQEVTKEVSVFDKHDLALMGELVKTNELVARKLDAAMSQVTPKTLIKVAPVRPIAHPSRPIMPGINLPPTHPANGAPAALPSGEKSILIAAAQYPEGVGREQASILTGFKRSTRDTYILRLMNRGYVTSDPAGIRATAEGVAALGSDYEPLPTGDRLQSYWLQRLPSGERQIFEKAIFAYPADLERDSLEESTGFKRSTRDAYILRLAAKKLLTTPSRGTIRASDGLFD